MGQTAHVAAVAVHRVNLHVAVTHAGEHHTAVAVHRRFGIVALGRREPGDRRAVRVRAEDVVGVVHRPHVAATEIRLGRARLASEVRRRIQHLAFAGIEERAGRPALPVADAMEAAAIGFHGVDLVALAAVARRLENEVLAVEREVRLRILAAIRERPHVRKVHSRAVSGPAPAPRPDPTTLPGPSARPPPQSPARHARSLRTTRTSSSERRYHRVDVPSPAWATPRLRRCQSLAPSRKRSRNQSGRAIIVGGFVRDRLLGLGCEGSRPRGLRRRRRPAARAACPVRARPGRRTEFSGLQGGPHRRLAAPQGVENRPRAQGLHRPRRPRPVVRGGGAAAGLHDQRHRLGSAHRGVPGSVRRPRRSRRAPAAGGRSAHVRRRQPARPARGATRGALLARRGQRHPRALVARFRSTTCRPSESGASWKSCCFRRRARRSGSRSRSISASSIGYFRRCARSWDVRRSPSGTRRAMSGSTR